MPLIRFPTVKGLVYTIDLSKIADRENPRTVEAPIFDSFREPLFIDWGDGNTSTASSGSWITHKHTYADGAGDVFTVVMRSATGHLPRIKFSNETAPDTEPTKNLTLAVTSVEHFSGWSGTDAPQSGNYILMHTSNLKYIDPRLLCFSNWVSLINGLGASGVEQSIESFNLDFSAAGNISYLFSRSNGLYGSPKNVVGKNTNFSNMSYTFANCPLLTGEYLVFWKEDGTLDNSKYPNLTTGYYCYRQSTGLDLAQIPTAYGGTMTV